MPTDPELLAALRLAIQAQPDAIPLRLHLAGLLLASGAEAAALDEYTAVLARDPLNRGALEGGAAAAERLGAPNGASSSRAPLQVPPSEPARPEPAPPAAHEHEAEDEVKVKA